MPPAGGAGAAGGSFKLCEKEKQGEDHLPHTQELKPTWNRENANPDMIYTTLHTTVSEVSLQFFETKKKSKVDDPTLAYWKATKDELLEETTAARKNLHMARTEDEEQQIGELTEVPTQMKDEIAGHSAQLTGPLGPGMPGQRRGKVCPRS